MDKLIPLVMKLQDAFNAIDTRGEVELPQIVVVGGQSTGKSSVLESIVGKDFLPRGNGIVTRCPLVLQLRRIDADRENVKKTGIEHDTREHGIFLHNKEKVFYDFHEIRQEIESQTNKQAGITKGVSQEPISLTIFSPKVVDLTLVDLPGMTKVPVHGQPQDIEKQIRNLVYKFASPANALILALTAANTDLANSDALQMARELDPEGKRTIGIVTKIDLMDEGTDAIELLKGSIYPLKLGYYGVKCRSQKNIDDRMTIEQAIQKEKEYFGKHAKYAAYSDKLGVPYLSTSLNKILIYHIQQCIPSLNKQITEQLQQKEREFSLLAQSEQVEDADKGPMILNLINMFLNTYRDQIEGQFVKEIAVECQGGSRINYIFHEIFNKVVNSINPFEYLSEQDIQTAIKNASALSPSLFVPEGAFEVLIRQQIARLLEPSLDCAYEVYEELRKIVISIKIPELQRYYKLESKICDVMEGVLDKCLTPTTEMIANLIEIENAHINTNHPDFIGSADSMLNLFATPEEQDKGDDDQGQNFSLLRSDKTTPREQRESTMSQEAQIYDEKGDEEEIKKQSTGYFSGMFGGAPASKGKKKTKKQEETKAEGVDHSETMISRAQTRHAEEEAARKARQDSFDNHTQLSQVKMSDKYMFDKANLPPVVLDQIPHKMRAGENQSSARVLMETRVIQNLILSYFNLVKKNITDLAPKTIMAFLVHESRRVAQTELIEGIYKQGNLDALVIEDPMITAQRENCKKVVAALKQAQSLLGEVTKFKCL